MALSGSFSGSIRSGNYKLRVDWTATQSVSGNTSKITATMYLVQASSWSLNIASRSDNKTTINGTGYTWTSPAISNSGGKTTKLATVTSGNIAHDADGTKSVTLSAVFNIDAPKPATTTQVNNGQTAITTKSASESRMEALANFVAVQSDAALRQVAGCYAYDNNSAVEGELSLRSNADEINDQLEQKLSERLDMAGIEVIEARINYLAYAPEIAAVMLRRQQADAIISAREKIVEGAVSMVKMAIDQLADNNVVELDEERKAAMVSNLLVVLCSDEFRSTNGQLQWIISEALRKSGRLKKSKQ